jgi:hypothetical protein
MKIFYKVTDRNTVSFSDPLRENKNTFLLKTLNNTPHTPKKGAPLNKKLSIKRVQGKINNTATYNFYKIAQQNNPIIIIHYFNVFLLTYVILKLYFTCCMPFLYPIFFM